MALSSEVMSFSWVVEEHRILAVLQPKCASSSFLWGLSELAGNHPADRLDRSIIDTGTNEHSIYDPWVHRLPGLGGVSASVRRAALESHDWMRLGVTRNPYSRFYSAWENRIFLPYPGAPPELLGASADVMVGAELDLGESFRQFVDRLSDAPWLADLDHHFHRQLTCLRPDQVDYTDLVDVSGVASLGEKIAFRTGQPFALPRTNEGLGIDWRTMYDRRSAEWVEQHYGADFEAFGYGRSSFPSDPEPVRIPEIAVRLVDTVRRRDDRIRAFAAEARRTHVTRLASISARRRWRLAASRLSRSS